MQNEQTIDKVLPVAKRHLLLANAVVWGAPGIPTEFFASFYPGLSTALIVAGATFLTKWLQDSE